MYIHSRKMHTARICKHIRLHFDKKNRTTQRQTDRPTSQPTSHIFNKHILIKLNWFIFNLLRFKFISFFFLYFFIIAKRRRRSKHLLHIMYYFYYVPRQFVAKRPITSNSSKESRFGDFIFEVFHFICQQFI